VMGTTCLGTTIIKEGEQYAFYKRLVFTIKSFVVIVFVRVVFRFVARR
jgi:hypothetical protein